MRYYKVKIDGKWCVYEDPYHLVDEIFDLIVNEDVNDPITVQAVEMTEEEFAKLEEFEGW